MALAYVCTYVCECMTVYVSTYTCTRSLSPFSNARDSTKRAKSRESKRKQEATEETKSKRREGRTLDWERLLLSLSLSLSLFRWGKNKNSEFAVCLSIGCKPRDLFTRSVLRVFLASSVAKCVRRERAIWFFPYTHVYNRARVHSSRFNSRDRA